MSFLTIADPSNQLHVGSTHIVFAQSWSLPFCFLGLELCHQCLQLLDLRKSVGRNLWSLLQCDDHPLESLQLGPAFLKQLHLLEPLVVDGSDLHLLPLDKEFATLFNWLVRDIPSTSTRAFFRVYWRAIIITRFRSQNHYRRDFRPQTDDQCIDYLILFQNLFNFDPKYFFQTELFRPAQFWQFPTDVTDRDDKSQRFTIHMISVRRWICFVSRIMTLSNVSPIK